MALGNQFASKPEGGLPKTILYLGWKLRHCTFPPGHPQEQPESHLSPHRSPDLLAAFVPSRRGGLERRFGFQGLERLKGGAISKSVSPFLSSPPGTGGRSQVPPRPGRVGSSLFRSLEVSVKGRQPVAWQRRFISGVHRGQCARRFPGLCQQGL